MQQTLAAANPMALPSCRRTHPSTWLALGGILLLFSVMSVVGVTWGLPSRSIDRYLFGDGEVWSGEKIYRLAKAEAKFSPTRGADVDVDPIQKAGNEPISLTATEEEVARIYLRYRLYTYQPDEMITMMALAGMRPGKLDLDPRLYQYGGLFIYPVGALIKLCGLLGLIDVRSDVVFYLDHPDEFGKFYVVARAYSAAWGLIGVIVVYGITRRVVSGATFNRRSGLAIRAGSASDRSTDGAVLDSVEFGPLPYGRGSDGSNRAGLLSALLFTLMPVVVCMSHEGKPHLPGAVLMLLAVYCAMRTMRSSKFEVQGSKFADTPGCHPERSEGSASETEMLRFAQHDTRGSGHRQLAIGNRQFFWWMCVCCGAALGMVLSSWPILVLIPLVAFRAAGLGPRGPSDPADAHELKGGAALRRILGGCAVAFSVYFITNPYVLINAFANREVLRSNFGNSLAMYEIARIGEGFLRVVELTFEGATLPVVVFGLIALVVAVVRKSIAALPLIVVATLFFVQFVLIGAGKPAEYGRFGIFTNTALAIGAACILGLRNPPLLRPAGWLATAGVAVWMGWCGSAYLNGFATDAGGNGTRMNLARMCSFLQRDASTGKIVAPLATFAEPAPYCYPPIDFAHADLRLVGIDSYYGHIDRDAFAFAPIENAGEMFLKYAEGTAFAPIFRTARFVADPALSFLMIGVDSVWRPMPVALGESGGTWRRRIAQRDTPLSWANKPYFDSVLHYLTKEQFVPLGR